MSDIPDFETVVQELGSGGTVIPKKFVDEDTKIEEFFNAKKKYY